MLEDRGMEWVPAAQRLNDFNAVQNTYLSIFSTLGGLGLLLGTVGLLSFLTGVFGVVFLSAWWVVSRLVETMDPIHLTDRVIFYFSMGAILLGAQFITIGFLAELITAYQRRDRDAYSIKDQIPEDESSGETLPEPSVTQIAVAEESEPDLEDPTGLHKPSTDETPAP